MKKWICALFFLSSFSMAESTLSFKDIVRSLEKTDSGYQVTFQEHAAIYQVSNSNKEFTGLEAKLKKSQISGSRLVWSVNPDSLQILK